MPKLCADFFIRLQSGRDREAAHFSRARGRGPLQFAGMRDFAFQRGAGFLHQPHCFFRQLAAYPVNLLVDRLHRELRGVDARNEVLQRRAQDSAGKHKNKKPHQDAGERSAEMKAAVEQNQRKAEKSQPQMAAHPGLRPSHSPDGKFLAQPQQSGKQHEAESHDAVRQTQPAAAARALR